MATLWEEDAARKRGVDEVLAELKAEFPDWSICWDDCRRVGRALRLGGWQEYRGEHGQLLPLWLENSDLVWLRRDLRSWEDMWARQRVRWARAGLEPPAGGGAEPPATS